MDTLGRAQLVVYAAVGVALLLIGERWLAAPGDSSSAAETVSNASSPGADSGFAAGPGGEDVIVDVTGAVSDSGVYRLPAGARVDDAVKRAGGATADASLDSINLAAKLTDGQQVLVPERLPSASAGGTDPAASGEPGATDAPISLGSATIEQLDTIEGIGPVTAQDIVDFRDEHGGVSSVDQLDQISGIGPATMEALRARLQP